MTVGTGGGGASALASLVASLLDERVIIGMIECLLQSASIEIMRSTVGYKNEKNANALEDIWNKCVEKPMIFRLAQLLVLCKESFSSTQ